ncbi:L-xylulose 5-phosphate 3-epimerase [Anaerohalosphaera lusitana]|uniref:L-xylulose 5-phosphate 3-epimerase n=1 Tax=Anaerohalosphaera lusitana TaxID=1936003 RepID=A0A1U9NNM9_9BACT|nr:sugar phosphate isomerase/epimerase family protein [Anaerohalosphaera lusitana]AQT69513.1 L-xylulose 5-phosphate 3-epimerase [Anaerohalosphaera lusitana]
MIKCDNWPTGVCSWSASDNLETLGQLRSELGLEHLHLHAVPAIGSEGDKFLRAIKEQGWQVTCTMVSFEQEDYSTLDAIKRTGGIVPDESWDENRQRVLRSIDVTADLGVQLLSFHLGFIDMEDEAYRTKLSERILLLADAAKAKGVRLLLETGQESASELRAFLESLNHDSLGVNFDPANMLLYDKGDPVEAVKTLGGLIEHVHIKDALAAQWGKETPWGDGDVDTQAFLTALKEIGYDGALAIERECGKSRFEDVKKAIDRLVKFQA